MKNFFRLPVLLGLLFATFSAGAQGLRPGDLIVRSEDGSPIAVSINERRFNRTGAELRIENVSPGRKRLIIYRLVLHSYDGGATARVVYEGRIVAGRDYATVVTVNTRSGVVSIQNPDAGYAASTRPNPPAAPVRRKESYPNNSAAGETMNPENIREAVEAKTTDTERLKLLQEKTRGQALTVASLRTMLGWLSFEESRLELLKITVNQVRDRSNLSSLADLFQRSENRRAFEALI